MLTEVHAVKSTVSLPHMSTGNLLPAPSRLVRLPYRTMQEFDSIGFVDRIKQRLEATHLSPRAASLKAGAGPDLIRNLFRGLNRMPRGDHLIQLSRVLGVSESWLLTGIEGGSTDTPAIPFGVRFGGVVEAGAFRREDGLDQDAEQRLIPLPTDPRYPAASQFAFAVVGDSMTEAKIYEGMYVLGLDVHAWERIHGEPGDGKLVVVARHRNGDDERELTVKRLRLFRDRMELQPESKNPRHEAIVFPLPHRQNPGQDDDAEAQIIAVVLSATWILT